MRRPAATLTLDGARAHRCRGCADGAARSSSRSGARTTASGHALAAGSAAADVEPGATAVVELGYGDGLETVLTGT